MNLFALNGAAINGSASVAVLAASANVTPTVAVGASATRIVKAAAAVTGTVAFGFSPLITRGVAATIDPQATLTLAPLLTQAASANVDASADIQVIVYRSVLGAADFLCTAQVQAIPASTLGSASITPAAAFTAAATRIQPGCGNALGMVNVSAAPVVTRYVAAAVACAADIRVEAQRNRNVDAYANVAGAVNLATPDSGIVQRQVQAHFEVNQDFAANATYIYRSAQATFDAYCGSYFDGLTVVNTRANFTAAAALTAAAQRSVLPSVQITGTASVTAPARQKFSVAADTDTWGTADVSAMPTVTQPTEMAVQLVGDFAALGVILRSAESAVTGTCDVSADGALRAGAAASIAPTADVQAAPARICLAAIDGVITPQFSATAAALFHSGAVFDPVADIAAAAKVSKVSSAAFDVHGDVGAAPVAVRQARVLFDAVLDIGADARLNIEAFDTAEDTMYRLADDTEFVRPFEETEMRRAA